VGRSSEKKKRRQHATKEGLKVGIAKKRAVESREEKNWWTRSDDPNTRHWEGDAEGQKSLQDVDLFHVRKKNVTSSQTTGKKREDDEECGREGIGGVNYRSS